jgi:hypothetical protein
MWAFEFFAESKPNSPVHNTRENVQGLDYALFDYVGSTRSAMNGGLSEPMRYFIIRAVKIVQKYPDIDSESSAHFLSRSTLAKNFIQTPCAGADRIFHHYAKHKYTEILFYCDGLW